ncbi:hypothetical protein C8J57DRAFT_1116244 [Mycena rebaudengoi]|nr:hypothetical protein C8J57DRAFT_1116244 [Mycena rebaudengoi]
MTGQPHSPPEYDTAMNDGSDRGFEKSTPVPEPRYVYYRIYDPDGAIVLKSLFDPGNPLLGRIIARSVPPPHTVSSLKRCIVKAENIEDPGGIRTCLFCTHTAIVPLLSVTKVQLIGSTGTGDGSTPQTAFALIFTETLAKEEKAVSDTIVLAESASDPQYFYYRLYTPAGEDISSTSCDPNDPAMGRIVKINVAPPYSVVAIKRRIAKVEGKPIYAYAELFPDISADVPLPDGKSLSLLKNESLGSTAEKPVVLVQPERRARLFNRPIQKVSNTVSDSCLLGCTVGKVCYTDGVPVRIGSFRRRTVFRSYHNPQTSATGIPAYLAEEDCKFLDC